jgi:hypothetical protein
MDYPYIRAWGRMIRSPESHIAETVERAREQGAPPTACYEKYALDGSGPTGQWVTFCELKNEVTRGQVQCELDRIGVSV